MRGDPLVYNRRRFLGADASSGPAFYPEYFVMSHDFSGSAALGAGTANGRPSVQPFSSLTIRIDSNANFRVDRTQYVATDPRVYVNWRDETAGRFLNRGALDLDLVAGIAAPYPFVSGAGNPQGATVNAFEWLEPHVIAAGSAWRADAADYSGAQNTVRICYHGAKLWPGRAPWDRPGSRCDTYFVKIPDDSINPSIAGNATLPFSIQIDNEADFVVTSLRINRTGAALVRLVDGRDRFWFSADQHVDNVGGNGAFANVIYDPTRNFGAPRFVPRGSAISGQFQDLSGATNIVTMVLAGYRIFD